MYGMKKSNLCLLPHDNKWKNDFENEKNRIYAAAQEISILIEHVGSTSIPTVHAKPILDIAILCDSDDLVCLSLTIEKLGYEYRGNYEEQDSHFYAVLDRLGIRYCQLHIYTEASEDWQCKLKFRDVLRVNEDLAIEYNEYKLGLAKRTITKGGYAQIKSVWLDEFMNKVMTDNA